MMRFLLSLVILNILHITCYGQPPSSLEPETELPVFVPYRIGTNCFYVDTRTQGPYAGHGKAFKGEWKNALLFDKYNRTFVSNELLNGKFIDTLGRETHIQLSLFNADKEFINGLLKTNKTPSFLTIFDMFKGNFGLINTNGKTVLSSKYISIDNVENDNNYIIANTDKLVVILNNKGKVLFKTDKYVSVHMNEKDEHSHVLKYFVSIEDNWIGGYLGDDFKEITPPLYDFLSDFYKGFGIVKKNEKWSFLNADGQEVVPFEYDKIGYFYDNIAPALKNNKYGMINGKGDIVIPFIYEDIGFDGFVDGIIPAKKDGAWMTLDVEGDVQDTLNCDKLNTLEYSTGLFMIEKDGYGGILDTKGNEIIKSRYYPDKNRRPYPITKNRILITSILPPYYQGVVNRNNTIIIPIQYSKIDVETYISKGFVTVILSNLIDSMNIDNMFIPTGFIDLNGKKYFEE